MAQQGAAWLHPHTAPDSAMLTLPHATILIPTLMLPGHAMLCRALQTRRPLSRACWAPHACPSWALGRAAAAAVAVVEAVVGGDTVILVSNAVMQ